MSKGGQMPNVRIGEILCRMGVISETHIAGILARQRETRQKFGQIAIRMGLATHEQVWEAWARQLADQEEVEPAELGCDTQALELVPLSTARRLGIVPLRAWGHHLVVAAPADWPKDRLNELAEATNCHVHVCNANRSSIRRHLRRLTARENEFDAALLAS
jgi:hypothetical protein